MRLDEISDWCLLETTQRDPELRHRLKKLAFQTHSILRIMDFSSHRDWALLHDEDYERLLERYVPAMKIHYGGKYIVDRVWNPKTKNYSRMVQDITAAKGIAAMMMTQKEIKEYRERLRS